MLINAKHSLKRFYYLYLYSVEKRYMLSLYNIKAKPTIGNSEIANKIRR